MKIVLRFALGLLDRLMVALFAYTKGTADAINSQYKRNAKARKQKRVIHHRLNSNPTRRKQLRRKYTRDVL